VADLQRRRTRRALVPDGREIFYRSGDRFYAVSVSRDAVPVIGKPTLLFTLPAVDTYDVFGNGFLLAKVTDPVLGDLAQRRPALGR
jgi:hypothetical protein